MSEDLEILSALIEESREHLDTIEPDFLEMENSGAQTPPEMINRIFRAMHSIKGGFGFVSKRRIVELAHIMENVLMRVRDGQEVVCKPMVGALIAGTDTLRMMIEDVEASDAMEIDQHLAQLRPFTEGASMQAQGQSQESSANAQTMAQGAGLSTSAHGLQASAGQAPKALALDDLPPACRQDVQAMLSSGQFIYGILAPSKEELPTLATELLGAGQLLYQDEFNGIFLLVYTSVLERAMVTVMLDGHEHLGLFELGVDLWDASKASVQQVGPAVNVAPASSQNKNLSASSPNAPSEQATIKTNAEHGASKASSDSASKAAAVKPNDSIRVRTEVLSKLVDTAGELILGRNRVMDVVGRKIGQLPGIAERLVLLEERLQESRRVLSRNISGNSSSSLLPLLEKEHSEIMRQVKEIFEQRIQDCTGVGSIFQNFSQVSSEIQNGIMGTRLQAVGTVFSKFPRVIRDMNQKLGKDIDLIIEGEHVELDKSVIEGLGDPLTHLVRNSADHGIEVPAEREKNGKSRKGIVRLIARHEGGQVHVIIEDDGAGINTVRVKEKAVENGLLSQEEANAMPEKEAFKLIFAAGLSTAKVVSDVSGRGVGMDVVRTNIEKLGGRIDIDSKRGYGTTLTLILPLTLAIIPSLGVESGGRHYAIPQVAIEELVRVAPDEKSERIAIVGGRPVLKLREQLLPIVRLSDVLGLTRWVADGEGQAIEDRRQDLADRRSLTLDESASMDVSQQRKAELKKLEEQRNGDRRGKHGRAYIVVLKSVGVRYGLVVDKLHSPQEVVVKPLSDRLKDISLYAGATIRSDGNVAMILDADGIAREAKIRMESRAENKNTFVHANIREAQTMLEFRCGSEDNFAVNLSMVSRIEEIDMSKLQKTGKDEFLRYENSSLRVIRLHECMDIAQPKSVDTKWYVLVPRLVPHPVGIIIEKPLGIFETDGEVDTQQVQRKGVHGTLVLAGRMIMFLDLYALFDHAVPELYPKKQAEHSSAFRGKKVLVAEDTALFRKVMKDFLHTLDFQTVDVAINGALAYEQLHKENYDLLITDIVMPEMDGMQLTRAVRSNPKLKELPIIAVTSLMNEADKKRILDSGVNYYQQKLDKASLTKTLTSVLCQEVKA